MKARRLRYTASVLALAPVLLSAQINRERIQAPLQSWAAPLYWQPSTREADGLAAARPETTPAAGTTALPTAALVFVGMTPCRVVDTRAGQGFTGAFGPPSLGGGSRTFPIQSSGTACPIPSNALAYSFNVTVVPQGIVGYITVYPTGQAIPNAASLVDITSGNVLSNAVIVPAGINGSIDVFAQFTTDLVIDINGYYAPQSGITLTQGSAGTPSLSFAGDAGTGIFSSGAGNVSIANGGNNSLTVTSSGLVGIGTTSPGTTLDANGMVRATSRVVPSSGSGTEIDYNPGIGIGGVRAFNRSNSSYLPLGIDSSPLTLNAYSGANVGIGTPTPLGALHVFSASPITRILGQTATLSGSERVDFLATSASSSDLPGALLGYGDLGGMRIQRDFNTGAMNTLFLASPGAGSGATEKMRVTGQGPVGIGTPTPQDVLEVNGSIRVDTGCVRGPSGSQIAGTCSSDERLKTNIEPFAPVLEKAVQLQPVRFDWRADEYPEYHFGKERSYGLIAQEVEKVLPELVSTDKHGFKAVNYSELPLVLLQAVRELNAENKSMQDQRDFEMQQNRNLESRIAALEAALAAMER